MKNKAARRANNQEELRTARELIRIAETLSDATLRPTVPLYYEGDDKRPTLLGSGVLLQLGEFRFLLTAGHVFDHLRTQPLAAGVPIGLLLVIGSPMRLHASGPGESREDRVDVGVMRLAGRAWETLEESNFLMWDDLDLVAPIAARQTYALVGFPVSVNRRPFDGDRIEAAAFRFGGLECERNAYEQSGIDPTVHVMVGFDKKSVLDSGGPRTAPDLYGASGGGLWRFGRRLRHSTEGPKFSAVATSTSSAPAYSWCSRRWRTSTMTSTRSLLITSRSDP